MNPSKIQIGKSQVLVLIFLYILANDLIRGFYTFTYKRDTWILVALGTMGSVIIFYFYSFLLNENKPITTQIEFILGKAMSKLLYIAYVLYFLLISYFNVLNMSETVQIYLIEKAPLFLLGAAILSTVFYVVTKGLEVFVRVCVLVFYLLFFIFILFMILIPAFSDTHFEYIEPILEKGFTSILSGTFKMAYSIPFGELFALLFIMPYVKDVKKNYKFGIYGILLAGFSLLSITFFNIIVVGPEAMSLGVCPSMRIAKRIDVKRYIQRFDLIIVNALVLHIVIKISLLFFVCKDLINNIIIVKKDYLITFLLCFSELLGVFFFGKHYISLVLFRQTAVIPYINLFFEVIIPMSLVLLMLIKRKADKVNT